MKARFEEARTRMVLLGAIVTCGIATAAPAASAATFSARETHRGLLIDRADGTTGRLVSNGWFRRPGEPGLVYREGSATVAGVWESGPDVAVVRSGTSENAPVIRRIVPSWNDGELRLTIQPAGRAAVRTTCRSDADAPAAAPRRSHLPPSGRGRHDCRSPGSHRGCTRLLMAKLAEPRARGARHGACEVHRVMNAHHADTAGGTPRGDQA